MSSPTIYFDGSYETPVQHGPPVFWQDDETRSVLFKVAYHVRSSRWQATPIGSRGFIPPAPGQRPTSGGYLVEESEPQDSGVAGIVEWQRVFAYPPRARKEAEAFVYNFQFSNGSQIIEAPQTMASVVEFEYFHTADPETIPLLIAYRLIQAGTSIYATAPRPTGAWIVAEDSTIARWRGNFWERKTRLVRFPVLTIFDPGA